MSDSLESVPAMPSLIRQTPRVWPVFVVYGVTLVVIFVLAVAVLGMIAVAKYGTSLTPAEVAGVARSVPGLLGSIISTMLVVAGGALTGAWLSHVPWRERLRLRAVDHSPLIWVVGSVGLIGVGLVFRACTGLGLTPNSSVLEELNRFVNRLSPSRLAATVVVIGVLPGIAEELLFRGYIQTRLSQRWGPRWGILWSALMFGVLHLDPVQGSYAVAMGVYLGFLVERSRSIIPAMICHAVNNTVGTLLMAWNFDYTGRLANMLVLVAGLLVVGYTVAYLRFHLPGTGSRPRMKENDWAG